MLEDLHVHSSNVRIHFQGTQKQTWQTCLSLLTLWSTIWWWKIHLWEVKHLVCFWHTSKVMIHSLVSYKTSSSQQKWETFFIRCSYYLVYTVLSMQLPTCDRGRWKSGEKMEGVRWQSKWIDAVGQSKREKTVHREPKTDRMRDSVDVENS